MLETPIFLSYILARRNRSFNVLQVGFLCLCLAFLQVGVLDSTKNRVRDTASIVSPDTVGMHHVGQASADTYLTIPDSTAQPQAEPALQKGLKQIALVGIIVGVVWFLYALLSGGFHFKQ
jgi:hypothetical protein